MREIPDTFCILPWTSVQARSDGRMAACCFFGTAYQDENGEELHLYRSSLADGLRSKTARHTRENLLAGVRDPNCRNCWDDEDRGQKSKRQHELFGFEKEKERILAGDYELEQPVFLDISTGSFCNLKCRICNADASSSWRKEAAALGLPRRAVPANLSGEDRGTVDDWPRTNPRFWAEIEGWLPKIRQFNFVGGEPFLSREHFELLRKSVQGGHAKHQELRYNTNGTVYPERWIEELFPHFRNVQIWVSCDDIGERFEYQRHGARWDKVLRNIDAFHTLPVDLAICLTVGALNIWYLPEALRFWQERGVKVYLGAAYGDSLSARCLPATAKQRVLRHLEASELGRYSDILLNRAEPFLELLREPEEPRNWLGFRDSLAVHDRYRGESYGRVFPEAAAAYGL